MSDVVRLLLGALTELRIAAERASANPNDHYLNQQLHRSTERAKKVERTVARMQVREYQEAK